MQFPSFMLCLDYLYISIIWQIVSRMHGEAEAYKHSPVARGSPRCKVLFSTAVENLELPDMRT